MHVCLHRYMFTFMRECMHAACLPSAKNEGMSVCDFCMCMYVCMYACLYVRLYVCLYVYMS